MCPCGGSLGPTEGHNPLIDTYFSQLYFLSLFLCFSLFLIQKRKLWNDPLS